jgi:hypothetical protein
MGSRMVPPRKFDPGRPITFHERGLHLTSKKTEDRPEHFGRLVGVELMCNPSSAIHAEDRLDNHLESPLSLAVSNLAESNRT